jgi:hypothetical protein
VTFVMAILNAMVKYFKLTLLQYATIIKDIL